MSGFEKMSQNRNFWHLIPLNPQIKIFFQNSGSVTFLLYWHLSKCKISEKTNERSLRYLTHGRKDGHKDTRTDKGDY